MAPAFDPILLLRVVQESDGKWDTRNIDHLYHRRGGRLADGSVLSALYGLASSGVMARVSCPGGTGPAWRITEAGRAALEEEDDSEHA